MRYGDLAAENARLRGALRTIAGGCGHERCHVFAWIKLARTTLADAGDDAGQHAVIV